MKTVIWIASHLDCEQRKLYLKENIEFLSTNEIPFTVSVSGIDYKLYDGDRSNLNDNVRYRGLKPLKQFEHYELLLSEVVDDEEEKIVFLDDDDMIARDILTVVEDHYAGIGYYRQNFPEDLHLMTYANFDEVMRNYGINPRNDHCGSWITVKMLRDFFEEEKEKMIREERDWKWSFMSDKTLESYLRRNKAVCPARPNVLVRYWGEPNDRYWVKQLWGQVTANKSPSSTPVQPGKESAAEISTIG